MLSRKSLEDAHERGADKSFVDARLTAMQRAELRDYSIRDIREGICASWRYVYPNVHGAELFWQICVPWNAEQNGGFWARIEKDAHRYVLLASGHV